ncbi:MAG: hypothetical protein H8E28_11500 [Anaerolineae bacterium]|nr:hypothetical protein [Anaerolineae bacterium]
MSKDRLFVLDLLDEGKISVPEAVHLIEAITTANANRADNHQPELTIELLID